jgi:hypothetical protein
MKSNQRRSMGLKQVFLPNNIYLEEQFRPLKKILRCKFCGVKKAKKDWLSLTKKLIRTFPIPDTQNNQEFLHYVWCPECDDHRHLVYDFLPVTDRI